VTLYAEYLAERTDTRILESAKGFVTYQYMPDGKTVYIIDIYTQPEERKTGRAAAFADLIAAEAKEKGCTEMIGTVVPSTKGATTSLKVLLAYGMTLKTAGNDLIVFSKEL